MRHLLSTIASQTGCGALNHAALLGSVKICELLLASGANINGAAHDGSTPLHKAAQGGRTISSSYFFAKEPIRMH
ncbi:Ankyrin repeat-containing domain [Phytophthora cactorum]|nr:Ankyrin repeat-containing domain [Phytophthora cactorum]